MNAPLVTSLGHAGLRIETPRLRLLCDPWISPGGAFLGSWWQFPDNRHLAGSAVLDADWVAVSHEHLDHLDLSLLGSLPPQVRVVIPRYPAATMRNRLLRAGVRHVVEVGAWERLPLNDCGDWLTVIPEMSPMCHDAAILVVAGGCGVLHSNDARLTVAQCRRAAVEAGGRLDLMCVQMSGASWHPICYEYPKEVVKRICAEKRESKFRAVTRLVRSVKPQTVVPYAGPPCFLDPTLAHHNDWIPDPGVFPDQGQALRWLRDHLPAQKSQALLPGDVFDCASGAVTPDPHWGAFDYNDVAGYLCDYATRRSGELREILAAHPDPDAGSGLGDQFAEHFAGLGRLNDYFLRRIDMVVRFEVSGPAGGTWDVHLRPAGPRVDLSGAASEVHYRFRVESRWLLPVLAGDIGWEDLLLSLRFSAWRSPDIYNDYLVGLLKHADATALAAVERYETTRDPGESVVVTDRDRQYEVSRYCPHAGEDLREGAVVADGVLRCLGHNFEFDLETGSCRNARCEPLRTRALEPLRT